MSRSLLLSIDGGGIRGVIPLCALVELEAQLRKPAREVFAFMSGTSTGAIICAGLAAGLSAERILEIYSELGDEVFKLDLLGFISSLGSFKYRSKPLHDRIVAAIGDPMLNELPVDIMLPAMRVRDGRPFYFVKDCDGNNRSTGRLRLADCVTASAAAPTFFDAWDVPGVGQCIDGGVTIAGNPAYQTCVEAFEYGPRGKYLPSNSTVVALGTGYYPTRATPSNLIAWVRYIVGQLLDEPSEQQTQLVQRHYGAQGAQIIRWNPELPREIAMDDVRAIPELKRIGQDASAALDWAKIVAGGAQARVSPGKLPRNIID
jgi:patatin-like phospholipase/acyl hydrolase